MSPTNSFQDAMAFLFNTQVQLWVLREGGREGGREVYLPSRLLKRSSPLTVLGEGRVEGLGFRVTV